MPHLPSYWVLLADGHNARLLEGTRPFSDLHGVEGGVIEPALAHRFAHDVDTDRPGRSYSSADGTRSAIEPGEDPIRAEERAFAEDLAQRLDHAARGGKYDRLIIAAPPRFLGDIRTVLGASARAKLNAAIDKDFVKLPAADLPKALMAAIGF
ncbi:host attachment protein [Zavarzinia aquatilis]|uniref:Host attachment protein n=1 Tax=Zavarzinia aquatilis TaxID=2211142 RepID=A0A317EF57_9PROT|nr:host attachment protein [Zavarzinia aquatilis]PWR24916.1 host attachment protein [Zavarzinia aquatilis]